MRDLRGVWVFLMQSSVALAVIQIKDRPAQGSLPLDMVCGLLFLVTFLCFYCGDQQLLRQETKARIVLLSRDHLALLFQGALFNWLALACTNPSLFVRTFGVLLVVNSLWLSHNRRRTIETSKNWSADTVETKTVSLHCHEAAKVWASNNWITAAALIGLELTLQLNWLAKDAWVALGLLAIALNRVVDLKFTWWFYRSSFVKP